MNKVILIGAGNIGSRHLQGLKKIKSPLSIYVVDPSQESLSLAKQRYEQISSNTTHKINFNAVIDPAIKIADLAIIATSADVRRKITEQLLSLVDIKYIIFEKLLFQKQDDFEFINNLISKKNIKVWVNCSMRVTPFYSNLKNKIEDKVVHLIATGSQYGLITNTIHFIDYLAYLTESYDFKVYTHFLNKTAYESKRKGFLDFYGTLDVVFKNGSRGIFINYPTGKTPITIEIINKDIHALANETDRSTWIFDSSSEWRWVQTNQTLQFQSDLTNIIVEDILEKGECNLTSFELSSKLHITLLEELKNHLNQNPDKKYDLYPFT